MPLPVQLKEVVFQLEIGGDACRGYVNRKTGEVVSVTEEVRHAVETDDPPEGGWLLEAWQDGKRVLDDADFIALPSQYDIHEYAIMERFCLSQDDDRLRDRLLDAIRGRGAFRRFKDLAYKTRIEQDWYRYRDAALKRIAADFLEAHNIPFTDEAANA
jgi:Uncharacterised protein family (UPF0158)